MSNHASCASIHGVWYEATTRDTQDAVSVTHKQEKGRKRFLLHSPEREYVHPCDAAHIYDRRFQGATIMDLADAYRLSEHTIHGVLVSERKRRAFCPLVVAR